MISSNQNLIEARIVSKQKSQIMFKREYDIVRDFSMHLFRSITRTTGFRHGKARSLQREVMFVFEKLTRATQDMF